MSIDIISIVENIRGGTLLSVAGMTLAANIIPGLPEEIFLILVGYVVALGHLPWWLAYVTLATPLIISDTFIYTLAKSGNTLVMKMQKRILGDLLEKNAEAFEKNREMLMFGTRFLFHFRIVGLVVAGFTKMPFKRFILIDFLAVSAFVNLMLAIGVFLRSRFLDIKDGVGVVQDVMSLIFIVVLCIVAFFVLKKYLKTFLTHIGDYTNKGLTFLGITKIPDDKKEGDK